MPRPRLASDALAIAQEFEPGPSLWFGGDQSREPGEWHEEATAVGQVDLQFVGGDLDTTRERPPFGTCEILAKCLVDHRLVAAASAISAFAKPLEQVVLRSFGENKRKGTFSSSPSRTTTSERRDQT